MAPSSGSRAKKSKGIPVPAKPTIPREYREMLLENAQSRPSNISEEGRSIKKRRIGGKVVLQGYPERIEEGLTADAASTTSNTADYGLHRPSDIYLSDSDDSAADGMDWEEVGTVRNEYTNAQKFDQVATQEDLALDIVLGERDARSTRHQSKRKPITATEKRVRVEIHKMHILCLLSHISLRNYWCNDAIIQKLLRRILSKKMVSFFHLDGNSSQHKRSVAFAEGLDLAVRAFRSNFNITARGMSRAAWADSANSIADIEIAKDLDLPMQKLDFQEAGKALAASRDVGTQLFCALLRGIGVEARLVCSLQVLPLSQISSTGTSSAPALPMVNYEDGLTSHDLAVEDDSNNQKSALGSVGGRNRHEKPVESSKSHSRPKPGKRIIESSYPVYWVEAFDEAQQKWIAVDPLVTNTIGKPSRLEPPASDPENHLTYVVVFEDDGSARDVTQRYTKAFNAKTRKERVEVTPQGDVWWKRTMRLFRRKQRYDRDQIEDTQLAARLAQEGMPSNVQDFKDHPFYVLERHLKKHEVIHPKREVGKVGVGRVGGEKLLEPVYRRQNVQSLKSAEKWYRQGRQIIAGEQPLKRITARRQPERKRRDEGQTDSDDEDDLGVGLYSMTQTIEYQPAPVVDGKIPKNAYGNLDIYTPGMIPSGASHVSHPETRRIAKLLNIDSADAVTGFTFKGRHGTANVNGAVIPTPCCEAVEAVIEALEDQRIETEAALRSQEALRGWKRFMSALRIQERVKGYQVEGETDEQENPPQRLATEDSQESDGDHSSTANDEDSSGSEFNASDANDSDEGEGGFLADDAEETRPPMPKEIFDVAEPGVAFIERIRQTRSMLPSYTIVHGPPLPVKETIASPQRRGDPQVSEPTSAGGFIPEDDTAEEAEEGVHQDEESGGFLPEDHDGVLERSFNHDQQNIFSGNLFEDSLAKEIHVKDALNDTIQDTDDAMALQEIHDLGHEKIDESPWQIEKEDKMSAPSIETAAEGKDGGVLENETQELGDGQGSVISEQEDETPLEDPDEEDADPEWLV